MSETYISDWTKKNPSIIALYLHEHRFICVLVFCVFVYLHWLCLYFVSILYSWLGHLQIAGNRSAHAALSINLSPPLSQRRSCRKHLKQKHLVSLLTVAITLNRRPRGKGSVLVLVCRKLQQWHSNNFKIKKNVSLKINICLCDLCWVSSVVYPAFGHLRYICDKKTFSINKTKVRSSLCENISGLKGFQFRGKYNWFGFKDLANPLKAGAPREFVSVGPVLLSILFKAAPILHKASQLDCFRQNLVN